MRTWNGRKPGSSEGAAAARGIVYRGSFVACSWRPAVPEPQGCQGWKY
jgi:hypothetical protein